MGAIPDFYGGTPHGFFDDQSPPSAAVRFLREPPNAPMGVRQAVRITAGMGAIAARVYSGRIRALRHWISPASAWNPI